MPPRRVDATNVIKAARALQEDAGLINHKFITKDDPALQRHNYELLGPEAPIDLTPVEFRHVRKGYVLIEWMGTRNPYDDPQISWAVRLGILPTKVKIAFDLVAIGHIPRIDGYSRRIMLKVHGMGADYVWGEKPGSYVQEVAISDAIKLLDGESGSEFRQVGAGVKPTEVIDYMTEIGLPGQLVQRVRSIQVVGGPVEKLVGLHKDSNHRGWFEPLKPGDDV